MDSFVTILVICIVSGLAFLLGSLLVVAKLPRTATPDGPSTVEWNGVKVTTNNVFVALTLVSAALAVAVPLTVLWLNSHIDDSPVILRATLPPSRGTSYSVVHSDDSETKSSVLTLFLYKSRIPQLFSVSTATVDPISIEAHYAWVGRSVVVTFNNDTKHPREIVLQGGVADLGLLPFSTAAIPGQDTIAQTPVPKPAVPSSLRNLPDPILPQVKL